MLTSILPPESYKTANEFHVESNPKTRFKTGYTLENVFKSTDPPISDLRLFVNSRGVDYESLDENEQTLWSTSWTMNRILSGYLVYAVVFPCYLKRRIKLRDAGVHWITLNTSTPKGKSKSEDRLCCHEIIQNMTAQSVFRGTSDMIESSVLVKEFLGLSDDDEGDIFFKYRDFTPSTRTSSAYSSCSAILSHLWFVTTVLGRPCTLDSVTVPIRGHEMALVNLTGKVSRFSVDWKKDVFEKIPGYKHRKYAGLFMERLTSDLYLDTYPSDAFLVYKSTVSNSKEKIKTSITCSTHNMVVVPCFDTLLSKTKTCELDALDINSISMEFGEEVANKVSSMVKTGVFTASLDRKMGEAIKFFSDQHIIVRRFVKQRLKVVQSMDPSGVKSKLAKGRTLDARDFDNVQLVKDMIRNISLTTWSPMKNLLFKSVDSISPDMDDDVLCEKILRIGKSEKLSYKVKDLGLTNADISNVCFLLSLTMSFQRSQLLRDSTVDEFIKSHTDVGYILSLNREIKTSGASDSGSVPMTNFVLTPSQSMMVHFVKLFGNQDEGGHLMVNERGSRLTQNNLAAKYRIIGKAWLGISNLSPHIMRSFWTTHLVEDGSVNNQNMQEFASYLQLSPKTLMTSYVAAGVNNEAHRVGKRVLDPIMNLVACKRHKNNPHDIESKPKGKKLGKLRDDRISDIFETLSTYTDPRVCFKSLVEHRKEGCLQEKNGWFEWENTFFGDEDEKFFVRFVENRKESRV